MYLTYKYVKIYLGEFMKKLFLIILIIFFLPLGVSAAEGYPTLPDNLAKVCLARFGFNDEGSTVLYEKIPITDSFSAWMIGWFWEDYKIVIGITDECDIIYFNRASLSARENFEAAQISGEEGFENALEFLSKALGKHRLHLTRSKGYTYNFSEFYNGIRVLGHDATVVADKATGEIYYYKGFGKYNAEYKILEKRISSSAAMNTFFDKIGLELVYSTSYDAYSNTKTCRPMYIFNNKNSAAVDAETGEAENIVMYDYNYYYNDSYYDEKFSKNNSINTQEGRFEPKEETDGGFAAEKLKNIFYALRRGYEFKAVSGEMIYANGAAQPAVRVDIAPEDCAENIAKLSELYDSGDIDVIAQNVTGKEYIFARAYVNAETGEILGFKNVPNKKYSYRRTSSDTEGELPRRVSEFIVRATEKSDELRLFSTVPVSESTTVYTYARYVNGARVIGEGAVIEFNSYANDITGFYINMNLTDFSTLEGVKTPSQMAEIIKEEIPFQLCYADSGKNTKKVVYDFSSKSACFDPISGIRTDNLDRNTSTRIFICKPGYSEYIVNGQSITSNPPVISKGRVYVPLRFLAENLGFEVVYENGIFLLKSGDDEITLRADAAEAVVNGKAAGIPDAPVLSGDTAYISANSIRIVFGLYIKWDEKSNKIFIIN